MKQAKKSLTSILTLWFLTFTIIPIAFISGYSTVLYKDSINLELQKRLEGNIREIGVSLAEFEGFILTYGKLHATDPSLAYYVATRNTTAARRIISEWLKTYTASHILVFDKDGELMLAQERGPKNQIKAESKQELQSSKISKEQIKLINKSGQYTLRETQVGVGLSLSVFTRIIDKRNKVVGYLEEIIRLDQNFINSLRKRLNLEAVFFDSKMKPALSSYEDFMLYPQEYFPTKIGEEGRIFFDLMSRGEPFEAARSER
jgi:two-component system NtrC family sensor kinase